MAEKGAQFKSEYRIDELIDAIKATAEIVDAKYDETILRNTLTPLSDVFEGSGVAYRTTTRSPRTINIRYYNVMVPHDAFQIVCERGLLKQEDHPCMQIFPYIAKTFPRLGNHSGYGMDVGAATGVEKIWSIIEPSISLSEVLKIPGLPDSIHKHEDLLRELGMENLRILGVDFKSKSVNLYFMVWENFELNPTNVRRMFEAPGFTVPSEEFITASLPSIGPYYTFTYDSDEIQRVCFASHIPDSSQIPIFSPVMEKFINQAVTTEQTSQRLFYFNPTITREDWYTKIEICFNEQCVLDMKAVQAEKAAVEAAKRQD